MTIKDIIDIAKDNHARITISADSDVRSISLKAIKDGRTAWHGFLIESIPDDMLNSYIQTKLSEVMEELECHTS